MYPTKEAPNGGVFITKRIEAIEKIILEYELYAIVIKERTSVRILRKLIGKENKYSDIGKTISAPESKVIYSVIEVEEGLIDKLLNEFTGYKHQANKIFKSIVKIIGNKECDIIHGHWGYPTGLAIKKYADYCNKPCVITCHGSDINVLMKNRLMKKHIIETLKKVNLVEFVSKALQTKAISHGYDGKNSVIIPNGIDTVPGDLQIHNNKIIIGYVGNLIHIKGADRLISIIKNINKYSSNELEFHIIGDGEMRDYLEANLKFANVKFFGRISHGDVLRKMQEMKVLMLPSRNEGWPCVVLEAHSCGTPVVGSANGGIPEAINDIRLIVNEDDFELNFSQTVLRVINDEIYIDRQALIERAKGYTWELLVEETIQNYLKLIKKEDL